MKKMMLVGLPLFFAFIYMIQEIHCCNEAVCASIVSKCMLTQSCKCDLKNTTCSRDCFYCLDYLYTECCSCVEMCPKPNETDSRLSQKSHVEDLPEPIPELFSVLTEEKDRLLRWTSYTYPAHFTFITIDKEITFAPVMPDKGTEIPGGNHQINCTVAYMSQCMSWNKCKNSCRSMGASCYRWFHDGCCECIGSTCANYGINESRCLECPPDKDEMDLEEEIIIENPTVEKTHNSEDEYEDADEMVLEDDKVDQEKLQKVDST